jgi:phenylpropionate dioxygenase-like ring-hydroxylating dioxygenase large terminal subunit
VVDGELQCAYHGWRFGPEGQCRAIPASVRSGGRGEAHAAAPRPLRAQQGFLWVCPDEVAPDAPPPRFPHLEDPAYASTVQVRDMPASLAATAENILDVPHTAFLHGGWFRKAPSRRIRAEIERGDAHARARFDGEAAPGGLLGWLLAPGVDAIAHEDRFELPAQAHVEYRVGESHLAITSALTPVGPHHTRITAVASIKLRFASRAVAWLAGPAARRVLAQDAAILEGVSENARRFPEARSVSTEVDLLGPHIARLLRDAAHGAPTPPFARDVELFV